VWVGETQSSLTAKQVENQVGRDGKRKRCLWTAEEDAMLTKQVQRHGAKQWSNIAKLCCSRVASRRTGKQCRERWHNHLNPSIKKEEWSVAEDTILLEALSCGQVRLGQWAEISKKLPGRSDNSVKNRWNLALTRALRTRSQGQGTDARHESKAKGKAKLEPVLSEFLSLLPSYL